MRKKGRGREGWIDARVSMVVGGWRVVHWWPMDGRWAMGDCTS
jgi:hypothetical protein